MLTLLSFLAKSIRSTEQVIYYHITDNQNYCWEWMIVCGLFDVQQSRGGFHQTFRSSGMCLLNLFSVAQLTIVNKQGESNKHFVTLVQMVQRSSRNKLLSFDIVQRLSRAPSGITSLPNKVMFLAMHTKVYLCQT